MKVDDIVYPNDDPEKCPCLIVSHDHLDVTVRTISSDGGKLLQIQRARRKANVTIIERLVCDKDHCYGQYSQAHHRACQQDQFTHGEMEAAIDIALHAGALIANNEIHVADSRELMQFVIDRAVTFEEDFIANHDPESYMDEVETFADRVLREQYGQTKETLVGYLTRTIREERSRG